MLVMISARIWERGERTAPADAARERPAHPGAAAFACSSDTIRPVPVSPEQPVAVFASGVGGLTVLHELLVSLPTEDYVYLGDTARFPYGDRTQAELQTFAIEIADHLLGAGAKL